MSDTPRMIFVNLPVADLERSKAFYEALGFTNEPRFSDDTAAAMVWSDTIFVMILSHDKWKSFTDRPIADRGSSEVSLALALDSREAVDAMVDAGARRGAIRAVLGPSIGPENYEVGPEFRQEFLDKAPWSANLFHPGEGDRFHFNISTFVKNRLVKAKLAWVDVIEHDTCAMEDMYFSNRRRNQLGEVDYGRQGSVIMLEG